MVRFNVPPMTRGLFITLITLTVLNSVLKPEYTALGPFTRTGNGAPYLSIVPGQSIIYPWTFATASFVEQNVFGLAATGLTIFFGGRYLERAYGQAEFAKFVLFSTALPNVISFGIYIIFYLLSGNEAALTATISGGISLQASFICAFKQLVPEHTINVASGIIRLRVKHFPAIFLLANTISGVLLGTETAMFLAWLGFFISWNYLRFFRVAPVLSAATGGENTSTMKGDASDTFAFAEFFPEPMRTPIAVVADRIWELLVAFKICSPFSEEDLEAAQEQAQARAEGGLPSYTHSKGSARREEAERRRALALKALDQRLHAAAAATSTRAPEVPSEPMHVTVPAPKDDESKAETVETTTG